MDGAEYADAGDQRRQAEERAWLNLIAQRQSSAAAGLQRLIERYRRLFRSELRRSGLRNEDIEDAMQNIWIDVMRRAPNFDPAEGPPGAWLSGFVTTEIRRRRRANHQWDSRIVSTDDTQHAAAVEKVMSAASERTPESIGALNDLKDCVQRVFAAFKLRHNDEAWWLYRRHVEEWDLEQVAKYRGSSPHAASQFLSQARKKFRELVAPCLELRHG